MTKGIFISTENTADERVARLIDLLKAAGHVVTTSPINPANGSGFTLEGLVRAGLQAGHRVEQRVPRRRDARL